MLVRDDAIRKASQMDRDITLRIVLESPPAGVDFGIQKGRGSMS